MAIHVELEGKVRRHPIHRNNERGAVERKSLTKVTQEEDASVYVELTEGHPNLDAWSPDYRVDSLSFLAEREGDFGEWEPIEGTWEIDIHATPVGWLPTIMVYTAERPNNTVKETIERFLNLTAFSNDSLETILKTAVKYDIDNFDVKMINLDGGELDKIKRRLEELLEG